MTNFLDLRCPACGRDDRIEILANTWIRVMIDGTDADASSDPSHNYTPKSPAVCLDCDHTGTVGDFEPPDV